MAVLAQNTFVWGFRLAAAMAIVIATAMAIAIGMYVCLRVPDREIDLRRMFYREHQA